MYNVPYPVNRFDKVAPHLWIGGHVVRGEKFSTPSKGVEVGRNDGFDHVISLYTDEHSRVPSSVKIHTVAPINDGHYPTDREIAIIERLAEHALWSMALGWNVLIRCQAGYNRSGVVAARVLMRSGMRADEAIAAVREARSEHALCNEHFVKYLEAEQHRIDTAIAELERAYEELGRKADEGLKAIEETGGVRARRPGRIRPASEMPIENFPGQMAIDEPMSDVYVQRYILREENDVQPE